MKGKKKYIVPLLLAGVTTATGVVTTVNQAVTVSAASATYTDETKVDGAEIKLVSGFEDKYQIGDTVTIQATTDVADADLVYTVTKNGKDVPVTEDTNKYGVFTVNYAGYYNISVSAKVGDTVVSTMDNLSIWVEKSEATINLTKNSYYVVPAKIPTSQANLKIPAPTVTRDNAEGKEETIKVRDITGNTESVAVKLITPSNSDGVSLEFNRDDNKGDYYAVTPETIANPGTYQVVYEYLQGTTVVDRLESSFQVVDKDSYDTSKIDLRVKEAVKLASTGNIGSNISVPKITVVDANSNTDSEIEAYVEVVVAEEGTNTPVTTFNYDSYTFTSDKAAKYYVVYKIQIPLFGTEVLEYKLSNRIEVKDTEDPELYVSYGYEVDDNGVVTKVNNKAVTPEDVKEAFVNRESDIPSFAVLNADKKVKVKIPAMYVTDNADDYNDLKSSFKITWTGGASNKLNTIENPTIENEIELTSAGQWEIKYFAKDTSNNDVTKTYKIQVYESDNKDIQTRKTSIDLNVGTNAVSDKENILTFVKPTVTDNFVADSGNITADNNIETKVFYDEMSSADAVITERNEVTVNASGKCEIKVSELNEETSYIRIYAVAYIDNALAGDARTKTEYIEKVKVGNADVVKYSNVSIIRATDDDNAPDFVIVKDWNAQLYDLNEDELIKEVKKVNDLDTTKSINEYGFAVNGSEVITKNTKPQAAFDQSSQRVITLPEVKFTDKEDSNLFISIKVTNAFGEVVALENEPTIDPKGYNGTDFVYEVKNAQLALSNYGMYTVEYRAEDVNGHVTVKTFGIRVNDKTAPTIVIDDEDKFGTTINIGEEFKVPAAKLVKNGETIDGTITWQISKVTASSTGTPYKKTTNGFVPLAEATFYITYTAIDENGNQAILKEDSFFVTSKDTAAPTIELDLRQPIRDVNKWKPVEGTSYMEIFIPVATASDKETKKDITVITSVSGPNGTQPTVNPHTDSSKDYILYFKATAQGQYTVTYSATDDNGNEAKITKVIKVGDCDKPTLAWEDKEADLETSIQLNGTLEINLDKLILEDLGGDTTKEYLEDNLTVSLVAPDGTSVKNNATEGRNYSYTMAQTGNHTLKFVVKDNVGNTNTYSYTINVPNEEVEEENKISPVVGTVLVVLSVVVLAGVVIYFVASSKKKGKGAKSTKKSK